MPLEGDGAAAEAASPSSGPAAGATGDAEGLEEQLAQLLEQGHKIEAIKLYRERTGAGLAEAKKAVEQMQVDVVFAESDIEEQLLELLRQGHKIEAIKTYRQRTRSGLKDAKEAVEALAAKHGLETRHAGCAAVLLFALALAGGSLALLRAAVADELAAPYVRSISTQIPPARSALCILVNQSSFFQLRPTD